jgi:hypothetical protein
MGANATTFVPAYVAGEVLTAADLSVTNSGIPVFATTVTRDAAFGGTGEKVLSEGQFAYIEATDTTQYYNGTSWLALGGKVGQVVSTAKTDAFTTTSTSFTDITGLSVAITPSSSSSKVLVFVDVKGSGSSETIATRLMRDATAIYIGDTAGSRTRATSGFNILGAYSAYNLGAMFLDSPATTSATTYKMQMLVSASTAYVNRWPVDTDGAGFPRLASSITVLEILA